MRNRFLRWLSVGAVMSLCATGYAQTGEALLPPHLVHDSSYSVLSKRQVDAIVGSVAKRYPGAVVVGLIDSNGRNTYGWGQVNGKSANGDTIFETASVSKVFSGLLLSEMIQTGEVRATAPVDSLMGCTMPHAGGKKITLYELGTHTSGLPAWPTNRSGNTSHYSTANMMSYLEGCRLDYTPGQTMIYSNVGFALLGDALARKAGEPSYEQLLVDRICRPLGMHDTCITLKRGMKERLAIGHTGSGLAEHSSSPTAGGGADGIRSSANDLLKLLSAYTGLTDVPFSSALKVSYDQYETVDANTESGFGWYIDKPTDVVWKSGRLAGYRSFIAFSPNHRAGVVVLSSCTNFPAPELGKKLLSIVTHQRRS